MRIYKIQRWLLEGIIAGLLTGVCVCLAYNRWPDLWLGWFLIGGFLLANLFSGLADIGINLIDSRARNSD